jgi:SAM-dependent methyltransferase
VPCNCFETVADQQFTQAKATKELARYRRKGPDKTTRLLLDGLKRTHMVHSKFLDVGAGIGAFTFEMLKVGATHATVVEASPAYLEAASAEAARRDATPLVQFIHGDFVEVSSKLPTAPLVAFDRVICCYPNYAAFLAQAIRHAEQAIAFSYPRDRWYVKAVVWLQNRRRPKTCPFRTFVHPEAKMRHLIEGAGFELVSHKPTLTWSADVFVKRQGKLLHGDGPGPK